MREKQRSLNGAANDPSLAAQICSISEQQTGIDPTRSAVTATSTFRIPAV
jgi:hypothetical protein